MEIEIDEIERSWHYPEEESKKAIRFRIKGKDGEILLVRDGYYEKSWDVHFGSLSVLAESEIEFLAKSVREYIKSGEYLCTCGESSEKDLKWYNKYFFWRTVFFEDTGMIRTTRGSDGKRFYFPILKRI